MNTLITGRSGFVGTYCTQHFQTTDLALDGRAVDLRMLEEVCAAVDAAKPDAVIHLAAQSSIPSAFDDPVGTLQVNFLGTLNLLLALRATSFKGRLLFVGTGDVYGTVESKDLPLTEDRPPRPRNPYAVSKVAAEALCYQWSQTGPFEVLMVRPFNHIGPRQSTRFAVADFARQIVRIRQGKIPPVLRVGDIDATRDFTDVRDIVHAYGRVLESGVNGETYNVCSGTDRSLRSIIATLSTLAETPFSLEVAADRLRPSEQRQVRGSFERLHKQTGWHPAIPFEQTLADILEYWEQEEKA